MLSTQEWRKPNRSGEDSDNTFTTVAMHVLSAATSSVDLVTGFAERLREDQADTARYYQLQSAALPETEIRPQNRRALALLQNWFQEPDEQDEAWWDDFEQDLETHRFSLRESE